LRESEGQDGEGEGEGEGAGEEKTSSNQETRRRQELDMAVLRATDSVDAAVEVCWPSMLYSTPKQSIFDSFVPLKSYFRLPPAYNHFLFTTPSPSFPPSLSLSLSLSLCLSLPPFQFSCVISLEGFSA
jgi:hypothetical protein